MGDRDLISAKNVKIYIKSGGEYCPYCKSPEVEQDSMLVYDEKTSMVYRNMACLTCFREWTDLFKLYDVKPMVR